LLWHFIELGSVVMTVPLGIQLLNTWTYATHRLLKSRAANIHRCKCW